MKQALERFSIDKEGDRAHPQGQGQLAAAGKPTQPRPSFSDQIRASLIRPGDTFSHPTQAADISSQAICTVILKSALMAAGLPHSQLIATSSQSVPEIGLAFMGQSVAEAPSMAGQTAAGFARRSQVLETKDVPSLLRDQASPGHTDAGALSINRSAHMTLPEPRVTDRNLPLPGGVDHNRDVTISHRGTSVPATVTNQITVSTSPVKVLNPSAAAHLVQKSESLSRRASLAAKLQRMAESADVRSTKASDTSDGTSTKATSHSSQASSPAHISTSSDGYQVTSMMPVAEQFLPRPRTSLDRVRRAEPQEGLDPSAEQTSNAVDSMAADIRRRHLTSSSEREKTCSKNLQLPGSSLTDSIHQSNTGLQGGLGQTDEGLAMQPGHLPSLRRTLSDAAAQALDVVESMLCPIIPFSQLQIQRKIGDGSIGQVCAPPVMGLKLDSMMQRGNRFLLTCTLPSMMGTQSLDASVGIAMPKLSAVFGRVFSGAWGMLTTP